MKTLLLIALSLIINVSKPFAQEIKPLTVGDHVPDIAFREMLNHTSASGKLSDFNNKAIIIDMWFRECGACVAAMPHLDSLRKEFGEDVQIILASWQSNAEILEFWKENKTVGRIDFVQSVGDTTIRKYFPSAYFPHQIWIGKDRIIKSINDGRASSRENIKKLIVNETLQIALKEDELDAQVANAIPPMINIDFAENKSKILFYSYLGNYRKEFSVRESIDYDSVSHTFRYKILNYHFLHLYHSAYAGKLGVPFDKKNRIIREDTNVLSSVPDKISRKNFFSYDLIFRSDNPNRDFSKFMIADLDRALGFKSREDVKEILSYVITEIGSRRRYSIPLEANAKPYKSNQKLEKGKMLSLNRQWSNNLEASFMGKADKPLIFDLPLNSAVNFSVNWNTLQLETMNIELAKFDLQISLKKWPTKVIILSDAK